MVRRRIQNRYAVSSTILEGRARLDPMVRADTGQKHVSGAALAMAWRGVIDQDALGADRLYISEAHQGAL
jgi:hypothetical protein